jgi:alpha-L-fucosidase
VPAEATERLTVIGKWTKQHGEAMYGEMTRPDTAGIRFNFSPLGCHPPYSFKDNGRTAYFWCRHWPGNGEIVIGGIRSKVKRIRNLSLRKAVKFTQQGERLVMTGLPRSCPDRHCGVTIFKLECASKFRQVLGAGYVTLPKGKTAWG